MIPISKPYFDEREAAAAADTIRSGWVAQGPRVTEFEKAFADYCGAQYAVAVSSGTAALHLSLLVAGIKPGDEVICPSMSHIATANSIVLAGGKPVFGEVRQKDFNLDPADAENRITEHTKAILVAHQLGMPADIDSLRLVCDKHNLQLIEDAACAAGSSYKGKRIGSLNGLTCFSFHPRKVITTGEGGMVTTNSIVYRDRLTLLRQHGLIAGSYERNNSGKKFSGEHTEIGYNYRMTDIQAAIGLAQLEKLDYIVAERNRIAGIYRKELSSVEWLELPETPPDCVSNYQSFAVTVRKDSPFSRDFIAGELNRAGIAAMKGVMTAHRETAYKNLYGEISLPVTESASDSSLLLPIFVPMTDNEVWFVIKSLRQIVHTKKSNS